MTIVQPDINLITNFFSLFLNDFNLLFKHFEDHKKYLKFSPMLRELCAKFECLDYPVLYEDESEIHNALLRAMFENDDLADQYKSKISYQTGREQKLMFNNLLSFLIKVNNKIDKNAIDKNSITFYNLDLINKELSAQNLSLNNLTDKNSKSFRIVQNSLMFSLASFHNYLSIMVHGCKLTELVAKAKYGNKHAFCQAVHIDKNILFRIPYFKERYQYAQDHTYENGEREFITAIDKHKIKPHFSGRIRHRELYILFTILEACGWLQDSEEFKKLSISQICNICDKVGLDRFKHKIESETAVQKRLDDYFKIRG